MTMIVTLIAGRYIAQASDRRVTYPDGRIGDVMNKAVIIGRSGSAAYTGLAFIDGKRPTDEFLMGAIDAAALSGGNAFAQLAHDAARAVRMNRRLPEDPGKRMEVARTSFVMAGFVPTGTHSCVDASPLQRVATLTVVSNAQFDLSETWQARAHKKFQRVRVDVLPDRWLLHIAGQSMPKSVRTDLMRDLGRAIPRCSGPEPVARLISRSIQRVHETNAAVGPSVSCILIRDIPEPQHYDDSGRSVVELPAMRVPLADHSLREMNYFRGPRGDLRPEPVTSVFLPHPDHPEIAHGPSIVMPGWIQTHSPIFAPAEQMAMAEQAVKDLRARRRVNLALPKQFRKQPEPRTLP